MKSLRPNLIRNIRGQFLIEMVLMMVLTVGLFMAATNKLRESKALATIIGGPWSQVSGMLETGVWGAPEDVRKKHPNQTERNLSLDPRNM